MTIPLDRLYQFINIITNEIYGDCVIIYRFYPYGSKNIDNLNTLYDKSWYDCHLSPLIWCNDQEPLDYEFYTVQNHNSINDNDPEHKKLISKIFNLNFPLRNLNYSKSMFEKGLLLHSEKRSQNLEKYQDDNELIPVYYWSHAVIAQDWFRYAKHVEQHKQVARPFLIYNRAWSGTREYRLKFTELLIRLGLQDLCQTSINPIEPELGIHYKLHKFKNPAWQPQTVLENFFPTNTAHSHYSADFDIEDYEATDIEVVLETLFDDGRLHLTEKSLRPIACAQPFILAGTHGSLEYLRSYGFKTFGHIWDEQYDLVKDPEERLIRIADLMKQITNWTPEQRFSKMLQAQTIASYNKHHFFSQEFSDLVITELKTNLKLSFEELSQCNNYKLWIDCWTRLLLYPEVVEYLKTNQNSQLPTMESVTQLILIAQNRLIELANKNKT
jgi:hypothetical protein